MNTARNSAPSTIDPPVLVLYSRFEEFPGDWLARFVTELAERTTRTLTVRVIGRERTATDPPVRVGSITVELMGYVASRAVPELLGSATLAVYPYQDSLITRSKQSVKLLELLAAGCPVVASDVGDVARTVAGSGVTVSGSEPGSFAEEVVRLCDQPVVLDGMSCKAMSRVRAAFGFETITAELLNAYRATGFSK